jgi:glycosyltransferase involved in cell wall biosynthesis
MAYEKGVVFHGFMDNLFVREYLQKAFVYLHTSFSEACNMGIAEAMCLGKPIIAGKYSGGVPWQLDWGQAGLLVDVSKPEEIAKALVNVIVDSDLRVKLSLNARERAKALFNPDSICREYKYLYQQIIDTRV